MGINKQFMFAALAIGALLVLLLLYINIPKNPTPKFSQDFCLNAVQNQSTMQFAIRNGVRCFRTDINLKQGQILSYVA